jgi:hypothetical protein
MSRYRLARSVACAVIAIAVLALTLSCSREPTPAVGEKPGPVGPVPDSDPYGDSRLAAGAISAVRRLGVRSFRSGAAPVVLVATNHVTVGRSDPER